MTIGTDVEAGAGELFCLPERFADMDAWHEHVAAIRRGGAHFCLGAQFARTELRTMLTRLSQQLAHIELDGEPEWSLSHFVSGVKHLPVRYAFR